LYYCRIRAAKGHPDLHCHLQALYNLGVDGMSSDESDFEDDAPVYTILRKEWRAAVVSLWMRDIDAVHLSLRLNSNGHITQGNWPHPQRDSRRLSQHSPVKKLVKS
ncbi:hypothetical protein BU17DRAFT_29889, partial [Hysterangium stoloniferum]